MIGLCIRIERLLASCSSTFPSHGWNTGTAHLAHCKIVCKQRQRPDFVFVVVVDCSAVSDGHHGSQVERFPEAELHFCSRVNHQCADGESMPHLAGRRRVAFRLDATRLYRNIPSVHRNRRQFYAEWLGFARISARRLNPSKRLCSSFQ